MRDRTVFISISHKLLIKPMRKGQSSYYFLSTSLSCVFHIFLKTQRPIILH